MKVLTMAWVSSGTATEEGLADLFEALDLRGRHHQISQADAGKQHFAEGAGVKHASIAVQAFERRQRAADVAVLAVVIVFDDPGLLTARPFQQFQASWQRQ
jgi:hypothetical protein